jgi:hypothetical protein
MYTNILRQGKCFHRRRQTVKYLQKLKPLSSNYDINPHPHTHSHSYTHTMYRTIIPLSYPYRRHRHPTQLF